LGRAIALRLAEAGASVMITGRNMEDVRKIVAEIEASGGKAQGMEADAASLPDAEKAVKSTVKAFGSLYILVNNAGVYPLQAIMDIKEDEWDEVLDTNLKGVFFHSQAAARAMIKAGHGGRIVNIASMGTFKPQGALAHYDASKGGVAMLTKSFAYELAPHNIRVNAVAPGYIVTEGQIRRGPPPAEVRKLSTFRPDNLLIRRANNPAGMGGPDDIAKPVLFLVSQAADYITGALLVVDGGYLVA